jgi:hypothetical protein
MRRNKITDLAGMRFFAASLPSRILQPFIRKLAWLDRINERIYGDCRRHFYFAQSDLSILPRHHRSVSGPRTWQVNLLLAYRSLYPRQRRANSFIDEKSELVARTTGIGEEISIYCDAGIPAIPAGQTLLCLAGGRAWPTGNGSDTATG